MPTIGTAVATSILGAAAADTLGFALISGATQIAIGIGISFGLSALQGAIAGRPTSFGGTQANLQIGGATPYSIPFGKVATKGQLVFFDSYDTNNKFLSMIFVLGDWPCDGLDGMWIGDDQVGLIETSPSGNETFKYLTSSSTGWGGPYVNGIEAIRFFRGHMGQLVDADLDSNSFTKWTSTDVLDGHSYVHIQLKWDDQIWAGVPDMLWEVRGAWLYDWRKDDTNGGTGAHRWPDPTTWEWSRNPAVMAYNFFRGFFRPLVAGGDARIFGMGLPLADIRQDTFTTAANICDETVTDGDDDVPRYECALVATDDMEWRVPIDAFVQSMAGYYINKQGEFSILAGAALSPVATLSKADLVVGKPYTFVRKQPRDQLCNIMYGTYTNPDKVWSQDSFPPIVNTTAISDDGERLERDISLEMITSPFQAQRVARIRFREGRSQSEFTGVFGLRWLRLEPGDWINFTLPDGYSAVWRIATKKRTKDFFCELGLREVDSSIYD